MKKLPKELKKYVGQITPHEEALLCRIWEHFRITINNEQWNSEPIDELFSYCQEILGIYFNVPEGMFYKFVDRPKKRKSEAQLVAACRKAIRVLTSVANAPKRKLKNDRFPSKPIMKKEKPKVVPKPSPSVILRKGHHE